MLYIQEYIREIEIKEKLNQMKNMSDNNKWLSSSERKQIIKDTQDLLLIAYSGLPSQINHVYDVLVKLEFFDSPASSNHHNNFYGGLAKHSLHVVEILQDLSEKYPTFHVEGTTVIRAGLFHDLCKCKTYILNLLKSGAVAKKPFKIEDEYPIGVHGDKSLMILLEKQIPLTDVEKMMIRYHMGTFDSLSPGYERIKKKYPQVALMSIADQLATLIEDFENPSSEEE